jgi:hypothetical protein
MLIGGSNERWWIVGKDERPRPAMKLSPHVVLVCDIHHFSRIAVELVDRVPCFMEEFYYTVGDIVVSHGG